MKDTNCERYKLQIIFTKLPTTLLKILLARKRVDDKES